MERSILELATNLTIKAMGTDAASINWINGQKNVAAFLQTMTQTLEALAHNENPPEAVLPR